jgi:hypothetical protein
MCKFRLRKIYVTISPLGLAGVRIASDLTCPSEKTEYLPLFFPEQIPEVASTHSVRTLA